MNDNETKALDVYKAISAVQGGLAKIGVSKDRKNQQQGFAYRGIDDVYSALAPLLSENHLCILPRIINKEVTERTTQKGGVIFYTTLAIDFDFVSAIDGSRHTVSVYGEAMDTGDKSIGKAMSYAYKSMAFMAFSIPVEGQDNDPDKTTHQDIVPKTKPSSLPVCTQDKFEANIGKWHDIIEAGKYTADELIAMLSSKLTLSDEQKKTIRLGNDSSNSDETGELI